MKIVNIILSVLILLLAITAAVFSFFLFEKRTQLVKGWEKMSVVINKTAEALDKNSGTDSAKELTIKDLGHENYAALDDKLKKLPEEAAMITKQRDDLADTMRKAAEVMEVENPADAGEFKKVEKYGKADEEFLGKFTNIRNRNDKLFQSLCETAGKIDVSITPENLKSANSSQYTGKLSDRIDAIKNRMASFDSCIKEIASVAGASSPDLGDGAYKNSLDSTLSGVKKIKDDCESTKKALENSESKLMSINTSLQRKDEQVKTLEKNVVEKQTEIGRLQRILNGGVSGAVAEVWKDGSAEARAAVKGKIIDVNTKYGFVVVDLGNNTRVEQMIGTKINHVDPKIVKDVDMVVARNLDTPDSQYVGKIRLVKVDEDASIANVVGIPAGKIKTGDTVYFAQPEIEKIKDK